MKSYDVLTEEELVNPRDYLKAGHLELVYSDSNGFETAETFPEDNLLKCFDRAVELMTPQNVHDMRVMKVTWEGRKKLEHPAFASRKQEFLTRYKELQNDIVSW